MTQESYEALHRQWQMQMSFQQCQQWQILSEPCLMMLVWTWAPETGETVNTHYRFKELQCPCDACGCTGRIRSLKRVSCHGYCLMLTWIPEWCSFIYIPGSYWKCGVTHVWVTLVPPLSAIRAATFGTDFPSSCCQYPTLDFSANTLLGQKIVT